MFAFTKKPIISGFILGLAEIETEAFCIDVFLKNMNWNRKRRGKMVSV
jgi:hypothetical protein